MSCARKSQHIKRILKLDWSGDQQQNQTDLATKCTLNNKKEKKIIWDHGIWGKQKEIRCLIYPHWSLQQNLVVKIDEN